MRRGACRRVGRYRLRPRPQAARQDRQDRLPASSGAAGAGPAAGVLDPAGADPGVPGAAGGLPRPAPRAHRLDRAHPRGVLPPGRAAAGRGRAAHRTRPGRAAPGRRHSPVAGRAAAGRHRAGHAVRSRRGWTLRQRLLHAARHLAGARAAGAAVRRRRWPPGDDLLARRRNRFSSSRKAVRFAGLDVTVYSSDGRRSPGHCRQPGDLALGGYEAGKTTAASAPGPTTTRPSRTYRRQDRRCPRPQVIRQACHILAELGDDALTAA